MPRTEFQPHDFCSLSVTTSVAGGFLGHRGLMEMQVLTTPKKAAILLTPSLGLVGTKLLFTNILGMGMRVERGQGGLGNWRLTEDLQNLASNT